MPFAGTDPVSGTTVLDAPVLVAERYCSDHPSTDTAAPVGLPISTNRLVNGWFVLPPLRYASEMTSPVPVGFAEAVVTVTSGAAIRVAAAVAHSRVRPTVRGMGTFGSWSGVIP